LNTALRLAAYFPGGMALAYSDKHGIGWQDAGGWEVYIGKDLKDFNQKYALYQSISQQLAGQSITPAIISVEFLDAPYYRLEK
jgi:cell division protein FtsQ